MIRSIWALFGLACLALGAIGIILPLLPTVPFLLAAGFFFGKSSTRLHRWLMTHPVFGPPIRDWNQNGAISRRAKLLASLSILATFGISLVVGVSGRVLSVQAVTLMAVSVFIWSRPDR